MNPGAFVAVSDIAVPNFGRDALEQAFRARLGEVDAWPGFLRLEVWADDERPDRYRMVSWWESRERFLAYMRSPAHQRSHSRIPDGDAAPRPAGFTRYTVVAT